MQSIKLILIIFIGFINFFDLTAGAWTQKKNSYFFKISANYLLTRHEFNHKGDKMILLEERQVYKNTSFRDISFNIYYEYGLTDNFTLIGNLPFKVLTTRQTELSNYFGSQEKIASTSCFSDISLAAKIMLFHNLLAVSVQAGSKIPLGYDETPDNNGPRLGTANIDWDGYLILGRSLYPLPMYVNTAFGYRLRGGRFHDEILFNAETGYTAGDLFFKLYFELVKSTVTPPDIYGQTIVTPLPGGGGALPDVLVGDQNISKISPSISWTIKKGLAIQGEVIHILAGKNTISGTTWSLGLILFD